MKHFTISLCLVCAAWVTPSLASQKVSASYIIHNDAISTGARASSSASFKATGVSRGIEAEISTSAQFANTGFTWITLPLPQLTVKFAGTGSGSVNSNPSGIACTGGTCSAIFDQGSQVTLMQLPDSTSIFGGWTDACTNTTGDCIVTVNGPKNVTATFSTMPPLRTTGTEFKYFQTLFDAYTAASEGSTVTIQARAVELTENSKFNRNVTVFIKGGYDGGFGSRHGYTTLHGTLTVTRGFVFLDNLIIK